MGAKAGIRRALLALPGRRLNRRGAVAASRGSALEEEVPAGVVTLVVEDSKGHRQAITLSGPGGRIRIAVGEPGRRSGVWNVWANRGKSDVYIAARSIAGVQKYSLHETGDWRHQWTTQEQAEKFTGQRDRMLDRWERPDGGPGGWTRGLAIWVPQPDILDIPQDDQSHEGVTWLPEPSPGFAIGIHVVVAKTDRGLVPVKGAVPVEAFTLANWTSPREVDTGAMRPWSMVAG